MSAHERERRRRRRRKRETKELAEGKGRAQNARDSSGPQSTPFYVSRLERAYCLHPYAPFLLWLCAQAGKKKAVGFGAMSVENVEKSTAASPGTGQKRVLF